MLDKTHQSYAFVNGNGDDLHAERLTEKLVARYKFINMVLNPSNTGTAGSAGNEKIIVLMEKA